jgi:NAD(P)-dependent dehydrogenase (short-subunit alcohol dehydrogenase family)
VSLTAGPETTTSDVLEGVDLTGKTALVTGASAGLGIETVRALQSVGCEVVGAVRDLDKARGVVDCDLVQVDLSDLDSVRKGVVDAAARLPRIDLLVNNAGIMACPLMRTAQGFEMQLGTNHLGHFAWTTGLLPQLAADGRVVNVSSRGHFRSPMRWDDPHFRDESAYEKWKAYGQSKTANVLFTVGLAARGITSYALHPGVIMTELSRHLTSDDAAGLAKVLPRFKTVEQGAATTVFACVADGLPNGSYLEDCAVSGPVAESERSTADAGVMPYASDPAEAARLWAWSESETA